jgi:hypothetical protein
VIRHYACYADIGITVTGLATSRVSIAISGASVSAMKAMRWKSLSPYLDSLAEDYLDS